MTPNPPPIFTLELTPNVLPKFPEPARLRLDPKNTFPLAPIPPTIDKAPLVDDVEFVLLLIVYCPCNVVLNEGAPPEVAVVNRAPMSDDAVVACIFEAPLPYKTPLELNEDAPVPPCGVLITDPFQTPVEIVPKVTMLVCPTYPGAIEIMLPVIDMVLPSPLYDPAPDVCI